MLGDLLSLKHSMQLSASSQDLPQPSPALQNEGASGPPTQQARTAHARLSLHEIYSEDMIEVFEKDSSPIYPAFRPNSPVKQQFKQRLSHAQQGSP